MDLHLVPAGVEQSGLVAAAAEALEAALTGLVAAEAAQRREHACVEAALLLVTPLHVVGVGHLLRRRSVIHLPWLVLTGCLAGWRRRLLCKNSGRSTKSILPSTVTSTIMKGLVQYTRVSVLLTHRTTIAAHSRRRHM